MPTRVHVETSILQLTFFVVVVFSPSTLETLSGCNDQYKESGEGNDLFALPAIITWPI